MHIDKCSKLKAGLHKAPAFEAEHLKPEAAHLTLSPVPRLALKPKTDPTQSTVLTKVGFMRIF